ncbi:MAG TPA: hypothetical protein VLJ62_22085, partial [Burkholderiaceae bacterium]|nr:hypothetical protein [Burkholderiaceae bacterium]
MADVDAVAVLAALSADEQHAPPSAVAGAEAGRADSAKSPALPSSSAQPQAQAQQRSRSRDRGGKRDSSPSPAPIAADPTDDLLAATRSGQPSHMQPPSSPPRGAGAPSSAGGSDPAAAGAGASSSTVPEPLLAGASQPLLSLPAPAAAHARGGDGDAAARVSGGNQAPPAQQTPPPAPGSLTSKLADLAANFAQLQQQSSAAARAQHGASSAATDAASSPASAASAPRSALLDPPPAHCLVIDASRLAGNDEGTKMLTAIIAASSSSDVLRMVLRWLPQLNLAGVACAYTEPAFKRVHINLHTQADLETALKSVRLLVRCGSLPSHGAWSGVPHCCGPRRCEWPEMLQLSCVPVSSPKDMAALEANIKALLGEMQLDDASYLFSNSHHPSKVGFSRIVFNVLPRQASLAEMTAIVQRTHNAHSLCGGLVGVHAPNEPTLKRCPDCNELGHITRTCPRYAGVAIRLLFKQPVPFAFKEQLQLQLGARSSYLAHGIGEQRPHRKVTLLFDADAADAQQAPSLAERIITFMLGHAHLLHEPPREVNVADRQHECKECGFLKPKSQPAHACHFASSVILPRGPQQPPRRMQPAAAAAAAAAAAPRVGGDKMCYSWRSSKVCQRMKRGDFCGFQHPADHVVQPQICREFNTLLGCNRNKCKFPHVRQGEAAPSPAAAPPAVA